MREVPPVYPNSLCHNCAGSRLITSAKGSVFILCEKLAQKYPPQPVARCAAFEPKPKEKFRP